MFPFIAIGSGAGAIVFVCLNIALLDSLPGNEGAVMSLQSASLDWAARRELPPPAWHWRSSTTSSAFISYWARSPRS